MWLNVSAVVWNEDLKRITIEKKRQDDPLEFNYIEQISTQDA